MATFEVIIEAYDSSGIVIDMIGDNLFATELASYPNPTSPPGPTDPGGTGFPGTMGSFVSGDNTALGARIVKITGDNVTKFNMSWTHNGKYVPVKKVRYVTIVSISPELKVIAQPFINQNYMVDLHLNNVNVFSNVTSMQRMFCEGGGDSGMTKIPSMNLPSLVTGGRAFAYCNNVTELGDISFTKSTADITSAFYSLPKLTTVGNIIVSVDKANSLFSSCPELLDVSTVNLSGSKDVSFAFMSNSKLVHGGDKSLKGVTSASNMFTGCSKLEDVKVYNTSGLTGAGADSMFNSCSSLVTICGKLDFNAITPSSSTFNGCLALTQPPSTGTAVRNGNNSLVGVWENSSCPAPLPPPEPDFDVVLKPETADGIEIDITGADLHYSIGGGGKIPMTSGVRNAIPGNVSLDSITITGNDVTFFRLSLTSEQSMVPYRKVTEITINKFSPTLTSMFKMFPNCGVKYLSVANEGVTSGITTMDSAFAGLYNLLNSFPMMDTSSCVDMNNAFSGISGHNVVAFPLLDTSNVLDLDSAWSGCTTLTAFPSIDTSKVTTMNLTWMRCSGLTSFPMIDTSKVRIMTATWSQCTGLISFPSIDTRSVSMDYPSQGDSSGFVDTWSLCTELITVPIMDCRGGGVLQDVFKGCSKLESSGFYNMASSTFASGIWRDCVSLVKICGEINYTSMGFTPSGVYANCPVLVQPATSGTSVRSGDNGIIGGVWENSSCPGPKSPFIIDGSYSMANQQVTVNFDFNTLSDVIMEFTLVGSGTVERALNATTNPSPFVVDVTQWGVDRLTKFRIRSVDGIYGVAPLEVVIPRIVSVLEPTVKYVTYNYVNESLAIGINMERYVIDGVDVEITVDGSVSTVQSMIDTLTSPQARTKHDQNVNVRTKGITGVQWSAYVSIVIVGLPVKEDICKKLRQCENNDFR